MDYVLFQLLNLKELKNEIYFPSSYIAMKLKKTITLKNLSPIKIFVEIEFNQITNGTIDLIQIILKCKLIK